MKCYYDFHMHTALSPCGHKDMTPNNIVNMAKLCELHAIAITDHNTCENVEAVMKVASDKNLLIIPGMEVETREEIHIVVLFPSLESVYNMQKIIYNNLPQIKNKSNIFGQQYIIDENDEIIGYNKRLLLTATKLSTDEVFKYVEQYGGVAIPAHVDRPSYSIISNLGWIPEELNVNTIEVSRYANYSKMIEKYKQYQVIQSSDAHDLGSIFSKKNYIEVDKMTTFGIINFLKNNRKNF